MWSRFHILFNNTRAMASTPSNVELTTSWNCCQENRSVSGFMRICCDYVCMGYRLQQHKVQYLTPRSLPAPDQKCIMSPSVVLTSIVCFSRSGVPFCVDYPATYKPFHSLDRSYACHSLLLASIPTASLAVSKALGVNRLALGNFRMGWGRKPLSIRLPVCR